MRCFKGYVVQNDNSNKELISLITLRLTSLPDKKRFQKVAIITQFIQNV